jgi:hypothetical protein
MTKRAYLFTGLLAVLFISILTSSMLFAQESTDSEGPWILRWAPPVGRTFTYMLSQSGVHGDNIAVRTENFEVRIDSETDGVFHLVATGETPSENSRLGFRFQRALWPEFDYSVDEYGNTEMPTGQPFPPFINIPLFPEEEVGTGDTWSGGPVDILPDPNAVSIPFTYSSTLTELTTFRGDQCAVIETAYDVALDDGAQSYMPFIGLVQGDVGEEAGQGAPVGGVVEDSRAHEAGIEPGDLIIAAQGQRIRGWGGLEEILPQLVPGVPVEFTIKRGEEEMNITVTPEGLPLAWLTATGGMTSTCYFSLDRDIPLKVDLISDDLVFTLTNADGEEDVREADLHIIFEYQYGGR